MERLKQDTLSIRQKNIAVINGRNVYEIFLSNGEVSLTITNLGCCILSLQTPDKNGVLKNIVAGFPTIEDYLINRDYLGCIVGRYANRIAAGSFILEGHKYQLAVNNETNHLHGGIEGFHKKLWAVADVNQSENEVGVVFKYLSKDSEENYPGNLLVTVSYSLNMQNQLCIEYFAETDKATPVNLTNHSYFNLSGFDDPVIHDHLLQVNASHYTEKNERNLPTGSILPVVNTALDFKALKKIGVDINAFPLDFGYDHNFVLDKGSLHETVFAAELYESLSGRVLNVYTTKPAIQVYTANYWDGTVKGSQGCFYQKHGAVALETQFFPDSPNQPGFPNTILYPDSQYHSKTIYEFGLA